MSLWRDIHDRHWILTVGTRWLHVYWRRGRPKFHVVRVRPGEVVNWGTVASYEFRRVL